MRLSGGALRGAVYAATARARTTAARMHVALAAPGSLDGVNREDVRQMFLWLRARDGATVAGRVDKLSSSVDRSGRPWRPQYVWSVLTAGLTAHSLGIGEISVIELGVAGGNGLLALETAAKGTEKLLGVRVGVFGFDTGTGMPKPADPRDAAFAVQEGHFGMDVDRLKARLSTAELVLGPVEETVPAFVDRAHPPVGFVSVDLDYYTSTMAALRLLDADDERLLPRIPLYFQGVLWHPWTEFLGQRAAISEFNADHQHRKIASVQGLRYALPGSERRLPWPEMIYIAEILDHKLYGTSQHIRPLDVSLR